MKQIIVVTNDREKYEKEFPEKEFYITWCLLSVQELIQIRAKSNLILLCLDHEDVSTLNKMGLYLRDICIEDEKMLYVYGNKEDVDTMTTLVPSMFVKKAMYSFVRFPRILDEMVVNEVKAENSKPFCVIIDEDMEYVERLRVHLDSFFRVAVCRFNTKEINDLVLPADIILVSVEGKMKLSEFMGMFQILLAKKKAQKVNFYYLTPTNGERDIINMRQQNSSISISKQADPADVARFLTSQFRNRSS